MAAIVLLHTAVIAFYAVYIQSIGSGMDFFSELFTNFFFTNSSIGLEEISLLFLSLVSMKPEPLTKGARDKFILTPKLKEITVGLILGDLYARRPKPSVNTRLAFIQSIIHNDYLLHLYELFKDYCKKAPITAIPKAHKQTGKVYPNVRFESRSLPCFNYFYDIFYPSGKKCIPLNIGEILTPLSLAYWIADDGGWNKINKHVVLCTESFTSEEVELLINVLNSK
jgi:hypothetical protein